MSNEADLYKFIERTTSRHGRCVYYFRKGRGARVRLPDEYGSKEFKAAYFAALNGTPIPHVRELRRPETAERLKRIEAAARTAVGRARSRARAKKLECDIDSQWAIAQLKGSDYKCPLSGVPFLEGIETKSFMRPFAPSVDRINPSVGYTKENCRLIIFALNAMISDWGEEIMHLVARGYGYTMNKNRRAYPLTADHDPLT